jgi:UPF0716 family protein affecting phage T7 exclusion
LELATIVVLVLTALAGILLVLVEIRSRKNIAREKQQADAEAATQMSGQKSA